MYLRIEELIERNGYEEADLIRTTRTPTSPQSVRPKPTLKRYQLRPKSGKKTFMELPVEQIEVPPPSNTKQIKHMKKKLSKLNKIRHSKRKHNNLISKQNSIKKKTEELKGSCEGVLSPEESFSPAELEQAFGRAYSSYGINGNRMDADAFFDRIRQNLIDLINGELGDLASARVQTTAGLDLGRRWWTKMET